MGLSATVFGLSATDTRAAATLMDRAGWEVVWLTDHVVTPLHFDPAYPYDRSGRPGYPPTTPLLDAWSMIGHLVAVTSQIRVGTGVYILPLRHPLLVAQAVRTVVDLAPGRLELGLGVGWMREEFEALGERFEARGERLDEMLDVMGAAWRGEPFEHHGPAYDLPPLQQGGGPVAAPPLIFGGTAPAALDRAARRGDGWFGPPSCSMEEASRLRARLDELRERHGRADHPFRCYVRVAPPTEDAFARYQEAGFEDLVVSLPRTPAGGLDQSEVAEFLERTMAMVRSS